VHIGHAVSLAKGTFQQIVGTILHGDTNENDLKIPI
jgi:hypothetical protein